MHSAAGLMASAETYPFVKHIALKKALSASP
jgi:hypothetical protein